ncbi:MAG TPA: NAD(P)-dependent oxidoreductase [Ignavibacteriales bacterium]|nr:NAD(P)-dependent oxidoreductase [Ignavibacteriales bacterium]
MSSLKVLITGGSGLMGQYLNAVLSRNYEILTLYNENIGNCQGFNSARVDILDHRCMSEVFQAFSPDAVVHTAAVSNSEKAARMPESKVLAVNVEATKVIAALCHKFNAKMIYTSTDLVYDGRCGVMLKEDAPLNPVTLYAETKLLGEEALKSETSDYIILRTALLYGMGLCHAKCHFQQMYESLKEGKPVRLFYDQYRTPLSLSDAASVIEALIRKDIPPQVINFGGKERISRYGLGSILCEEAGISKPLLRAISMDEVLKSKGVKDVSMDTSKLSMLGIERKTIRDSVRDSLNL